MSRKLFYNARVLTQDKRYPQAAAFMVESGRFTAVGDDLTDADAEERIDLQGAFVLPGYHDAHIHIWKVGNLLTHMLDLRGVRSMEEMQEKLLDYSRAHPEMSWIQARGFNEADFPDQRMPNKLDLDKVISDRPVVVTRTCAHQIIVNSVALNAAQVQPHTPAPQGGEIKYLPDGSLAGHFTETAIGLILSKIPKYSAAELRMMVNAAQESFIRLGITSATDPAVDRDLLQVYRDMERNGELKVRVHAVPIRVPDGANKVYPNPERYDADFLKVSTVKFFADGGLSGRTAAVYKPYLHGNETGVLRLTHDNFLQWARESQEAGLMIATHAIGDAAIDLVVRVYQEIGSGIRHRIEHLGLPSDDHLAMMRSLGVSAVMQPIFIRELGKNFRDALEKERLEQLYPCRKVLDEGINLALSTDAPVVRTIDPAVNIRSAMDRTPENGEPIGPGQAITLSEAQYAYTMGSAVASGTQHNIGSITVGKVADFQILRSENAPRPEAVYIDGQRQ